MLSDRSVVLVHGIHDLSDLSLRRFSSHGHEHRADHLLVHGRILLHFALDERSRAEEANHATADQGESEIEDEHPGPNFH